MQFPAPCAADMRWLILTFAISTAASFALLLLFVWHCYLILTAQVLQILSWLPRNTSMYVKEGCAAVLMSGVWCRPLSISSIIGQMPAKQGRQALLGRILTTSAALRIGR